MPPCSFYVYNNCKCIVSKGLSTRYSKYICQARTCNVQGLSLGDYTSIKKEEERLSCKKEETTAKLLCLQKQKQQLRSKAKDLLCCRL